MRLLTTLCVAAIVVAFAVPAFAEVQNVKISGDIAVASIIQVDIDLDGGTATGTAGEDDTDNFFIQQIGLNVEADLTDNVSTYVRVINERDWNSDGEAANGFNIELDEAYVTLKEMLYAPLTVKMGRQNIALGNGFIIGSSGATIWNTSGNLPAAVNELSDMTAFDAISAVLDYDPWTINLIYSKIDENNTVLTDDIDLYVANVGYDFKDYQAEAEAYYVLKQDMIGRTGAAGSYDSNQINTIGLRGSIVPLDNLNLWAEGALQFGDYASSTRVADREAYAADLGAIYTFADVKWTPKLGLEYIYYSGEEASSAGDWQAWDSVYRGKFDTQIAEFRNITKNTQFDGYTSGDTSGNNNGATNEQQIAVIGAIEPMADVKVDAKWTYLWYDEAPTADRSDDIGHEIDIKTTYDYTEDVTMTLAGAVLLAGDYFPDTQDDTAAQIISSVKVEF